jgi:hypothetical protein
MWTEARVELLKSYCLTNLSALQICVKMNRETGSTFTRNSIIGKADRLGLMAAKPKKQYHCTVPARMGQERVRKARTRPPILRIFTPPPSPIESKRIEFFDLKDWHCRFITDGEGFKALFCGHEKSEGSYCAFHHGLTHMERPVSRARDPLMAA